MYVGFFDKDGNRLTSYVEGIHWEQGNEDSKKKAIEDFMKENKDCTHWHDMDENMQTVMASNEYNLIDGVIIEKPPVEVDTVEMTEEVMGDKPTAMTLEELTEAVNFLMANHDE